MDVRKNIRHTQQILSLNPSCERPYSFGPFFARKQPKLWLVEFCGWKILAKSFKKKKHENYLFIIIIIIIII